MGLDIYIEKVTDYRTDEKGRTVHTVTEVGNLRGCNKFLDALSERELEGNFGNCATHCFTDGVFQVIRKQLTKDLAETEKEKEQQDFSNHRQWGDETEEEFKKRVVEFWNWEIKQLKHDINALDEFFKENEIKILSDEELEELIETGEYSCTGEEFDVSASW